MTNWAERFRAMDSHGSFGFGAAVNSHGSFGFGAAAESDYAIIQKKLNELGANPQLVPDGKFGPKTKAAVLAFQKSKGLKADGIVGPITLKAMGLDASMVPSVTMGQSSPASAAIDAEAYKVALKAAPNMPESQRQYILTVARGEGQFGHGWEHPSKKTIEESAKFGLTGYEGKGSNNWGATQGSGSAGYFMHVDHHADGTAYVEKYKKHKTPEEGFLDVARIVLGGGKRGATGAQIIKDAIAKGNLRDAVMAQHANGYFELNPEQYLVGVLRNYTGLTQSIGWKTLLSENGVKAAAIGAGTLAAIAGAVGGLMWWKNRRNT